MLRRAQHERNLVIFKKLYEMHVNMPKELKLSPSYLLIGSENYIENIAKDFIKNVFCFDLNKGNPCNLCIDCKKVDRKIHHNILWLEPETQYTVTELEPIFQTAAFALDESQRFFFVLNKAQQLSQTCANSLLKLMEEPPRGYHFILTAQTKERILPTILSRCIIQNYNTQSDFESDFFKFFSELNEPDFVGFNQALQVNKVVEADLMNLIDQIHFFWMEKLKKAIENKDADQAIIIQRILDLINNARTDSIMPGSGKVFLRNLYMRFIMLS